MVKCRNPDKANDLVQATCERALSRSHQFQAGTRLDAWTITIMQSIWKNDLRRGSIRHGAGFIDAKDAGLVDTDESAEGKIFLFQVIQAVDKLLEAQKDAVDLVYVQGLRYEEATAPRAIPAGPLTSRLVRGRSKIAEMINGPAERERSVERT